jgi:hypothetical protein
MPKVTQVKADVPHELKCRVFSVLALRDQRFNRWVTDCMEAFLQQVEGEQQTPRDAPRVASTTGATDCPSAGTPPGSPPRVHRRASRRG